VLATIGWGQKVVRLEINAEAEKGAIHRLVIVPGMRECGIGYRVRNSVGKSIVKNLIPEHGAKMLRKSPFQASLGVEIDVRANAKPAA